MAPHPGRALGCLVLALAASTAGSAGCRGSCTEIGCVDGVSVTVDQPGERPLEACVGAVCTSGGEHLHVVGVPLGERVEVVVRVVGGAEVARAVVPVEKTRPNGRGCPPVCRTARARLTVDDQLVPT